MLTCYVKITKVFTRNMTKGNNGMSSKALRGSEISDQEKSVMLINLMKWRIDFNMSDFHGSMKKFADAILTSGIEAGMVTK